MFQLIYSNCRPGVSLDGSAGYTVRAATPQIDPAWLNYAPQLARYDQSSPTVGSPKPRLAFFRRDTAAIVVQSLWTRDHHSRPASFTHAVIDPLGQLGPRAAISMWGSPFWQHADDGGTTQLPVIQTVSPGPFDWALLFQHLQDESFLAMAEFLLTAWLRQKKASIVLLAEGEHVAAAIWLLTRCLPAAAIKDLSFATQDHDPAAAGVAVVGYTSNTGRLREEALAGQHWLNVRSRERSDTAVEPYAHFVCGEVAAGRFADIDQFVAWCEEAGAQSLDEVDLLHRVCHRSHVCTEQDILQIQNRPSLLRWLLRDPKHVSVSITVLAGIPPTHPASEALVTAFREMPQHKSAVGECLESEAADALANSDVQRALQLVGLCAKTCAAPDTSVLWREVVEKTDCDRLAVNTRLELAGILRPEANRNANSALVRRLLTIPLDHLLEVMQCGAQPSLKAAACHLAESTFGALPLSAIQALAAQRDVLAALLPIVADPNAVASVVFCHQPDAVLQVMANDLTLRSRIDLDSVMDYAQKTGQLKIEALALGNYARFWPVLLRGRYGDCLAAEISRAPIPQQAGPVLATQLRSILATLPLSPPVIDALRRRLDLLQILNAPAAPIAHPTSFMAAIRDLPHPDRRALLVPLLPRLAASVANSESTAMESALNELMELAGSETPFATASVLRVFAKVALDNRRLLSDANIAAITIAYAFGALGLPSTGADVRDQLVDLGIELTELVARKGGPALNHHIDRLAMRWPERPRDLFRVVRRSQHVNGSLRSRLSRLRVDLPEAK